MTKILKPIQCPGCMNPLIKSYEIHPHLFCWNCHKCVFCRTPKPVSYGIEKGH